MTVSQKRISRYFSNPQNVNFSATYSVMFLLSLSLSQPFWYRKQHPYLHHFAVLWCPFLPQESFYTPSRDQGIPAFSCLLQIKNLLSRASSYGSMIQQS